MEHAEADELRAFIRGLITNIRMNYGAAMALHGLDADWIFAVHRTANQGMIDWLENTQ